MREGTETDGCDGWMNGVGVELAQCFFGAVIRQRCADPGVRSIGEWVEGLVSPCWASHFFLCGQEKVTKKKATPAYGFCFAKLPSLRRCSRGSSRRDIHVLSLLARHPCLAPPCATPTLGLLKGTRDRVVRKLWNSDSYKALSTFDDEQTLKRRRTPFSEGQMESARRGARHGCRERRKGSGPPSAWMALVRRPPERGWNEGSRAQRTGDA